MGKKERRGPLNNRGESVCKVFIGEKRVRERESDRE